jgi:hypothetical protein
MKLFLRHTKLGQKKTTMNEKQFDKEFNLMEYIIVNILTDKRTDFVEILVD